MRLLKIAVAAALAATAGSAYAFHSGGVAECEGCHTMHNSLDGQAMTTTGGLTQYQSGPYLLQGSTQSEACLNCHEKAGDTGPSSYHISTADVDMPGVDKAPLQMTPGGDFGWLRRDYTFTVRGTLMTNHGERRGHNIVAPAFGYNADTTQTASPGGNYPAASLHCSSCHDPHGKFRRLSDGSINNGTTTSAPIRASGSYNTSPDPSATMAVGVYRILGGTGYFPKSVGDTYAFGNQVPAAVAPSAYNRTEATTQTRVAYGSNMSEWCANCHGAMHQPSYTSGQTGAGTVHPAGNGAKLGALVANYNAYVKSGDLSGTQATAYNSLVPFEEGSADYTTLKAHALNTDAQLGGADANSNVSCLSCHRVHASGFESMLRYPHANEFMTIADTAGASIYAPANTAQGQGMSEALQTAALYGRAPTKFAPYQRLLCNKCNAKD